MKALRYLLPLVAAALLVAPARGTRAQPRPSTSTPTPATAPRPSNARSAPAQARPTAPAAAAPARPTGRIVVTSEPRRLELIPGAYATLHIFAPETPVVAVNVGEVQALKSVGRGQYQATYVPPRETYPQVAIIVAQVGRAVGWLPLPLAGTGEVQVKAPPGGSASITVGPARFGPVQADQEGRARIRIVVPPGVRQGLTAGKRLNLNTPDVSHVFVTVEAGEVSADERATLVVHAFVTTPDGRPRHNAPLQLSASQGQLSAPREVEPGRYEIRWTLPPGAGGTPTVEARLQDESAFVSRASVQRGPPQPRKLLIDVDRKSIAAGEGTLDFTIAIEDNAGNPVDDVSPRVSISAGAFLGWTRGMPGRWIGHVAIPERIEGNKLVISAAAGDLRATREVPLVAGPVAEMNVEPSIGRSSGGSPVTFTVSTLDRFGNPTDDSPPKGTATFGTLGSPVRRGPGSYELVYRPPLAEKGATDEVRVRAGPVDRTATVRLRGAGLASFEIGAKGGAALRSGKVGPVAGGEVSYWWRAGRGQLGVVADGSWFHFSQDLSVSSGGTPVTLQSSTSYLSFTAAPSYRVPLGARAMLWLSAGGGLARVGTEAKLPFQTTHESKWVPTATAALSVGANLWGGYPFIEVRGSWLGDPKLSGLSGSIMPVFVQLGYRFDAF